MVAALSIGTALLQVALLVALLVGLRRRNAAIGANALVALGATLLPASVEFALRATRGVEVAIEPVVSLWIAVAGVLHIAGMWGLYEHETTWWWDHVTHVVSAALVAAVAYGSLHVVVLASPDPTLSASSVAGVALLLTLSVGVLWELVELVVHRYGHQLGVESVLIPYGRRDTALDLAFDALGAIAVVVFDVRVLGSVAAAAPALTRQLLVAAGGLVVAGSLGAALVLLVGGRGSPDLTE